jgi:hypothetical protein
VKAQFIKSSTIFLVASLMLVACQGSAGPGSLNGNTTSARTRPGTPEVSLTITNDYTFSSIIVQEASGSCPPSSPPLQPIPPGIKPGDSATMTGDNYCMEETQTQVVAGTHYASQECTVDINWGGVALVPGFYFSLVQGGDTDCSLSTDGNSASLTYNVSK